MRARGELGGHGVPRVAKLEGVHLRKSRVRRGVALGAARARRRRRHRRGVGFGVRLAVVRLVFIRVLLRALRGTVAVCDQRRDVVAPHDIRRERVHDGGDLRVGRVCFLAERGDERGGFAGELLVHDAVALRLPRRDRALVSLPAALLHRRDALEAADDALAARAVVAQPSDLCRALPELRERARDGAVGRVAKGHRQERARQRFGVGHLRLRQRVRQAPLRLNQYRVRLLCGVVRRLAQPGQGPVGARRHRHAREKSVATRNRSGTSQHSVLSIGQRTAGPELFRPVATPATPVARRRFTGYARRSAPPPRFRGRPRRSAAPRSAAHQSVGAQKGTRLALEKFETCATARPRGGERKQQQKEISHLPFVEFKRAARVSRPARRVRAGRRASSRWPRSIARWRASPA